MEFVRKLPPSIKRPLRVAYDTTRNVASRTIFPARYMSAAARLRRPRHPIKLHLGCGHQRLPDFINIDLHWTPATDYTGDISKLPCPDGSVSRIETYHVIEHIPRPAVEEVLREWYRVLTPGGVLVMECPDFRRNIEGVLAGDERSMYSIFGWQRFPGDAHHWGYTEESLSTLARSVGFREVRTPPAQDYHAQTEPCIRVEAMK